MGDVVRVALCGIVLGLYCWCLILALRMLRSRFPRSPGLPAPEDAVIGKLDRNESARLFFILLAVVVASRMLQYLLGHIMAFGPDLTGFNLDSMQQLWVRSDAPHYLGIAEYWYRTVGDPRFHIVFFPFYPMMVHLADAVIGNTFVSSLAVSNLALTAACYYLYKLALLDGDHKSARRAVKYLLLFPVAFFLGAGFSESVFIFLVAGALYYSRNGNFALAAFLGALAAFTRMLGVLAAIPILLEAFEQSKAYGIWRENGFAAALRVFWKRALWALLVPVGTFAYLLINKLVTGDWFTFMVYQREHWYQEFGLFFLNVGTIFSQISPAEPDMNAFLWIPELVCIVLTLVVMVRTCKTQRISYVYFALAYFLAAIAPTWLLSAPRYIMAMVPLYFMLASVTKKRWADVLLSAGFAAAQVYMMWGFVNGMRIY